MDSWRTCVERGVLTTYGLLALPRLRVGNGFTHCFLGFYGERRIIENFRVSSATVVSSYEVKLELEI